MADFARWNVAAEPAMPWPAGDFERCYGRNRRQAVGIALDDPIVAGLRELLERHALITEITATDLLRDLSDITDERIVRSKGWPGNARALGAKLRRLAPYLRRAGMNVIFDRESEARQITIERMEKLASLASPASSHDTNDANDAKIPTRSKGVGS